MAERTWKCQRSSNKIKCGQINPKRKLICSKCHKRRPPTKKPAHMHVLKVTTYDQCVELWGEKCGICGAPRAASGKRLNRDHDHNTGELRGLLCTRCNRALPNWLDLEWLINAQMYLQRPRPKLITEELKTVDVAKDVVSSTT